MYNKIILYILPIILALFGCSFALPEEDMGSVVSASEDEPTPIPLEQSTATVVFDLPDTSTPIPTSTPEPIATSELPPTPTTISQNPPPQANTFIYVQSNGERTERDVLQRAAVDQFGRAVVAANAIELARYSYIDSIRPSPQGDLAAVLFASEGGDVIYIYDFATGELSPLEIKSFFPAGYFLSWSHDGQFIFYTPTRSEQVVSVEVATGQAQLLTKLSSHGGAASPDGQFLILDHIFQDAHNIYGEVWRINLQTKEEILLFRSNGQQSVVAWSPDGKQVAYLGDCSKEGRIKLENPGKSAYRQRGLCLMNPDGSNRRLVSLKYGSGYGFYPSWSPDSRHIAFVTLDGPPMEILDDKGRRNWNEMAFVNQNIYILDTKTGQERPLVAEGLGHIDLAWSPDGSQLIFASQGSGQSEIWMANVDGTGLQQLTFDGQMKRHPLWHP